MTGSGTILADDPHFTIRHVEDIAGKHRKLVLFDRRQRISPSYVAAAAQRGFEVVIADELGPTLRSLAKCGALEILVEAGPQLTAFILNSGFWDEHVLIAQAPMDGGEDQIEIKYNTRKA